MPSCGRRGFFPRRSESSSGAHRKPRPDRRDGEASGLPAQGHPCAAFVPEIGPAPADQGRESHHEERLERLDALRGGDGSRGDRGARGGGSGKGEDFSRKGPLFEATTPTHQANRVTRSVAPTAGRQRRTR
jgi:hypothetical protein